MANKKWIGGARGVRQISTLLVGGEPTKGDTIAISIGHSTVTYTVEENDICESVAEELTNMLNSTMAPVEFSDVYWTFKADLITATGAIAGVPFEVKATIGGRCSVDVSNVTQATGPNHIDNPENWADGTLPNSEDTAVIAGGNSIYYGGACTCKDFRISSEFAGQIGLEEKNARGYREYRPTYCAVNASAVHIGAGCGISSTLMKLEFLNPDVDVVVGSTGGVTNSHEAPLQIKGLMNRVAIEDGTVEIAGRSFEAATINSLRIETSATVRVGRDVAIDRVSTNGISSIEGNCVRLDVSGGRCQYLGQARDIDVSGGDLIYQSDCEINQINVGPGVLYYAGPNKCECQQLRIRSGGQLADPSKLLNANVIVLEGSVTTIVDGR